MARSALSGLVTASSMVLDTGRMHTRLTTAGFASACWLMRANGRITATAAGTRVTNAGC